MEITEVERRLVENQKSKFQNPKIKNFKRGDNR
jgi:hypothetical protein